VLQMAGLMIAPELAERRLIQFKQNLAQLLGFRIAGREILSVNLAQSANEGVSVFAADFAILVAVAIVETCLAHAALMPGNAGGAKGPDFWCAFEDGEVKVIGDEPDNA
jgi:hypothetical protein